MGFKFEKKEYTHAPTPKPCGCGKSENKQGFCDGSHLNKDKE